MAETTPLAHWAVAQSSKRRVAVPRYPAPARPTCEGRTDRPRLAPWMSWNGLTQAQGICRFRIISALIRSWRQDPLASRSRPGRDGSGRQIARAMNCARRSRPGMSKQSPRCPLSQGSDVRRCCHQPAAQRYRTATRSAFGSHEFGVLRKHEAASQKAGSMESLSGETNISSVRGASKRSTLTGFQLDGSHAYPAVRMN